jgi:hypothetical protein
MNMSERVIMPLMVHWLKRWYSPKSPHPVLCSQPGRKRETSETADHPSGPAIPNPP